MGESSANAWTSKRRDIDSASTVDLHDRVPWLTPLPGQLSDCLALIFTQRIGPQFG
jgi:hypothetical protein